MKIFSNKKGITLIEILITIAVISMSVVFIFQGYTRSLKNLEHVKVRLKAINWLNNQHVQIERDLQAAQRLPIALQSDGFFDIGKKQVPVTPTMSLSAVDSLNDIFRCDLAVSWQDQQRRVTVRQHGFLWEPFSQTP